MNIYDSFDFDNKIIEFSVNSNGYVDDLQVRESAVYHPDNELNYIDLDDDEREYFSIVVDNYLVGEK